MKYSEYTSANIGEINKLFIETFNNSEGEAEGIVIGELVTNFMTKIDSNDFFCFVATDKNIIIGSVFFSKLTFKSNLKAYILSPMATLTEYQGKGIGQKLINYAHSTLKNNGVELLVTYGDINFYSKVGYKQITEEIIKAPFKLSYPEGWLAQSLVSSELQPIPGVSFCVDALNNADLW